MSNTTNNARQNYFNSLSPERKAEFLAKQAERTDGMKQLDSTWNDKPEITEILLGKGGL